MATGEIKAGRAYVELFVKGNVGKELDKLGKQFKQFGETVSGIGKKMTGVGVAIVGPMLLASKRFGTMGDELAKSSERTGVAVEALGGLKYAGDQSQTSLETVEGSLKKMSKVVTEAASGSKTAAETLAELGTSAEELQSFSPDQKMLKLGDALSKVGDETKRTALAQEIFGKSGVELLPMFKDGAAGVNELTQRYRELGLVISTEDSKAATKWSDVLDDLWKQLNQIVFQVGAVVAKVLQPFAEGATKILKGVIDWVKINQKLVFTVLAVGVAIAAAGAAILALGYSLTLVGTAMSGIVGLFKFGASALGLLLNPITLIVAGLGLLTAWFLYTSGTGAKMLAWLGTKFAALKEIASTALGGIMDALTAGDLGLAVKILWTGIQVAWLEGTKELSAAWINFKASFVKVAGAAFYGALELWQKVKASMKESWASAVSFFGDLWDGVAGTIMDIWDSVTGYFIDVWNAAVTVVAKGITKVMSLWDSSFDVGATMKQLDNDNTKRRNDAENERQLAKNKRMKDDVGAKTKRDQERAKDIADAETEKQAAIDEINKKEQALSGGADENAKKEIADLKIKKEKLEDDLKTMKAKAAAEAKKKGTEDAGKPDIGNTPDNIEAVVATATKQAVGIFNPEEVRTLYGGPATGYLKRIAKATEDTVKKLPKKIKAELSDASDFDFL